MLLLPPVSRPMGIRVSSSSMTRPSLAVSGETTTCNPRDFSSIRREGGWSSISVVFDFTASRGFSADSVQF